MKTWKLDDHVAWVFAYFAAGNKLLGISIQHILCVWALTEEQREDHSDGIQYWMVVCTKIELL